MNQAIGRAVDRILQLGRPHSHPELRTVLNISILSSGEVFNHKPETGWFSLDIRSLDEGEIAGIENDVRSVLAQVQEELELGFDMDEVTRIPGGQIPGMESSGLVRTAVAIARSMDLEPRLSNSGSSNLNVAIAGGTPAIGLGGERGGRRGYDDEWADRGAMMRSARHVLLLAAVIGNATSPGVPPLRQHQLHESTKDTALVGFFMALIRKLQPLATVLAMDLDVWSEPLRAREQ